MNCPGACLVFGSERHSYRELPLRLAEFGLVSRYEREGVLHGLLRVRAFTQDDAHVYCTLDQVADEVDSICDGDRRALRALRLRRRRGSSSRPGPRSRSAPTSSGSGPRRRCARRSSARAASTTSARGRAPSTARRSTSTSPTRSAAPGSCGTCQLDFQMPERFELDYTGRGQRRAPAGDDPPGAARLDGALRRDPDRALRRRASRSGWRRCRRRSCRSPTATPSYAAEVAARAARRPGCARGSTSARSRSGKQDPRRRARQGARTCWSSGDRGGRGRRGRRCARTATATWARWRSTT